MRRGRDPGEESARLLAAVSSAATSAEHLLNPHSTRCQYRPKTGGEGHDNVTKRRDASALSEQGYVGSRYLDQQPC